MEFHQPFVPPPTLYLFWGKSSFKGHYALGRVSSAQRVRKILNVGTFTGNKWEENTVNPEYREECHTEDHCTNVFCNGRFEQVSSTACTVSDIISYEICYYCWVSWIVFWYS